LKPRRVVALTLALNAGLCVACGVAWSATGSELLLAQGADSLMDVAVGIVLLVTVTVAARPVDANHPFGHRRAEPIGALITSVLAFVLAIEVARSAIEALAGGPSARVDHTVIGVLGTKFAIKLAFFLAVLRRRGESGSQAVAATRLDTFNDLLTTASSMVGAALVMRGWPSLDAWFALPVAGSIGFNGFRLARESVRYLMGEAPPPSVLGRLEGAAAAVPGVKEVRNLRAHFVGDVLHVEVVVLIEARSSATQGHDIALDVKEALASDPLVDEVFVHVDTGTGRDGT
jgi:cation diffusion facilitator family transporter